MRVLLLQLGGKGPNLALMRIAAHHRGLGDEVELRVTPSPGAVERRPGDAFDRVYASTTFGRSARIVERLRLVYPEAILDDKDDDIHRPLFARVVSRYDPPPPLKPLPGQLPLFD